MKNKINWHKEFNLLPKPIRIVGTGTEALLRIQHLKMEKERLKRNYQRSCNDINEHIRNCEEALRRLDDYDTELIRKVIDV